MLLIAALVGLFFIPSPWNIIVLALAALVETGELYAWTRFLRRYRVKGGAEGMIGQRAEVIESCAPEGTARVRGEIWRARAADGEVFAAGDRAVVTAIDGLTVELTSPPAGEVGADTFTGSEGA